MSTDVQTAPNRENLMDKNNTYARQHQDKVQNRRNTMTGGSSNSCGSATSIGSTVGDGVKGNTENNNNKQQHKKNKHDSEVRHYKSNRKRLQSFNGSGGKFFPPYKRRKKEGGIVPPTKFLLGGNICDPLNLNSLQDEEVNRAMNAVTPKSSPLPTPRHRKGQIEVIIPPNIHDPLNLADCDDDAEYEAMLTSPIKRSQKKQKKNKKRKHSRCASSGPGSGKEDTADETRLSSDERKFSEEELGAAQEPLESATNVVLTSDLRNEEVTEEDLSLKQANVIKLVEDTGSVTSKTAAVISKDIETPKFASAPTGSKTESLAIPNHSVCAETKSCLKSELNLDLGVSVCGKTSQPSPNCVSKEGKKENQDNNTSGSSLNTSNNTFKKIRKELKDKIVSPVIPQPGAWGDPRNHRYRSQPQRLTPQINKGQATPKFKENNARFQYGNYNRYYGYRNANEDCDVRLKVLARRKDLFENRDVLDVGCNVGHVTLAIARDFKPKKIVGIDIDRSLIESAKRNVKHYLNPSDKHYPVCMPLLYGPVNVPSTSKPDNSFPHNISFIQGNYVLESDVLLSMEQQQFDTILCLSITKWFHLNWGDEGLKRAFKRMYAQLRPGGVLILEPQPWHSYKKKRNLTAQIWKNYQNIELFPHKFSQFLLSEVGFTKCEIIGSPLHYSRGFQRPIKLFSKGGGSRDSLSISRNLSNTLVAGESSISKVSSDDGNVIENLHACENDCRSGNVDEATGVHPDEVSDITEPTGVSTEQFSMDSSSISSSGKADSSVMDICEELSKGGSSNNNVSKCIDSDVCQKLSGKDAVQNESNERKLKDDGIQQIDQQNSLRSRDVNITTHKSVDVCKTESASGVTDHCETTDDTKCNN